jgi:hypothetical protein
MSKELKIILATIGVTAGAYFLYDFYKRYRLEKALGNCADFIKDGFVYDTNYQQSYSKKAGDWAGCNVVNDESNPAYYKAINTKSQSIRLLKSDVLLRNPL